MFAIKARLQHLIEAPGNLIRNLKYLARNNLYEKETELVVRIQDETIENCVYEIDDAKSKLKRLKVCDGLASITKLESEPKSFSRYGDGEIALIMGYGIPFQKYDKRLADRLIEILNHRRYDLYVGIPHYYFHTVLNLPESSKIFCRLTNIKNRRIVLKYCDPDAVYLDSLCLLGYFMNDNLDEYKKLCDRKRNLFKGRKIAIVSGQNVLEKLEHDIFELASCKIQIHAPALHAFGEYDLILNKIKSQVPKDYLICLVLGPTATVMAAELAELGYTAWDTGHIAKDYNAFMTLLDKSEYNNKRFWQPD